MLISYLIATISLRLRALFPTLTIVSGVNVQKNAIMTHFVVPSLNTQEMVVVICTAIGYATI